MLLTIVDGGPGADVWRPIGVGVLSVERLRLCVEVRHLTVSKK